MHKPGVFDLWLCCASWQGRPGTTGPRKPWLCAAGMPQGRAHSSGLSCPRCAEGKGRADRDRPMPQGLQEGTRPTEGRHHSGIPSARIHPPGNHIRGYRRRARPGASRHVEPCARRGSSVYAARMPWQSAGTPADREDYPERHHDRMAEASAGCRRIFCAQ